MKSIYLSILIAAASLCVGAKSPVQLNAESGQPKLVVTTGKVTDIKDTQAKCNITIQGTPVNEKGVCFSDSPSPTINGKKSMAPSNPANAGTSIMGSLKPSTKYYAKAYAKSGSEVFYGSEVSFTTLPAGTTKNTGQKVEPKSEPTK